MGKARKVGWVLSAGKIDWREADKRAAHNSKLLLKDAKQQSRTAAPPPPDRDTHNLEPAPVIEAPKPASKAPARPAPSIPATPAPADRIELLAKLGALRDNGVLTEEEFLVEKQRVLGSTDHPVPKPRPKPKTTAAKPTERASDQHLKAKSYDFGADDPKDGTTFSREVRAKQSAFKKGWLTEEEYRAGVAALRKKHKRTSPGSPPGWQADPTGRHQHRYWDGSQWTQHVSDNGVAASDPVGT